MGSSYVELRKRHEAVVAQRSRVGPQRVPAMSNSAPPIPPELIPSFWIAGREDVSRARQLSTRYLDAKLVAGRRSKTATATPRVVGSSPTGPTPS